MQFNKEPALGSVLTSLTGERVPVYLERKEGKQVMFTFAALNDERTGLYLTSRRSGLVLLILPKSQEKLLEKYGEDTLSVNALRVVRRSDKGTSYLCELVEFS